MVRWVWLLLLYQTECRHQLFLQRSLIWLLLKLMADQQIGSETDYGNSDQDDYCKSGR